MEQFAQRNKSLKYSVEAAIIFVVLILFVNNNNSFLAHGQELNPSAYSRLLSKIKESVVQVSATDAQGNTITGSGFIYDTNGHIITDYHLATGKEKIAVT